jgi:hypothetical protein
MSNQEHGVQDAEPADSDSIEHDDLFVDDEARCEVSEHVTNLENPTIAFGVTFEDGAPLRGLLGNLQCVTSLKL